MVASYLDDLPQHLAWWEIQWRQTTGELTADRVKELYFKAFGDEDAADKMAASFLLEQMKRNTQETVS